MELAIDKLEEKLRILHSNRFSDNYFVPELWLSPETNSYSKQNIKPTKYFLDSIKKIREIAKNKPVEKNESDWTKSAIVYNLFVRYATAFDHDGDGQLNPKKKPNQFQETGTFLKSIALLPYLNYLGINTIYCLPITSIGKDGRKGNLGSPYAIKNPYQLDENLSEPILEMSVNEQFKAFVEACHLLNMKVVVEFVFRTASIDSDLALEHPEWFYWIKEKISDREQGSKDEKKYGPPIFSEHELIEIKKKVANNDLVKLPIPSKEYREMFVDVPTRVARVENRIIGVTGEIEKKNSRIPGAFADWPPDDIQPAWSDVTYLRLYSHPSYNYIAYNTVRMYEQRLSQNQYRVRTLWDNICNIIPYYQQNYNIDGVMIDMGHALPQELRSILVDTARKVDSDFAFWEENFELSKKSVKEGYNLSVGYLPFDLHDSQKVQNIVKMLATEGTPIPFFGTGETHNTHRTAQRNGGIEFSKFTWALVNFLPSIPLVLNGFELGEQIPINTGLGFSFEEIQQLTSDKLALFSLGYLNWEKNNICNFIKKITDIRNKIIDSNKNFIKNTLEYLETSSIDIIAFKRMFSNKDFIFIANMNCYKEIYFSVKTGNRNYTLKNELNNQIIHVRNGWIIYNLKPFEVIIGELKDNE